MYCWHCKNDRETAKDSVLDSVLEQTEDLGSGEFIDVESCTECDGGFPLTKLKSYNLTG